MQTGYESEKDLFVARACLDMLIKSKEVENARRIRQHFAELPQSVVLNFVDFVIECVDCGEYELLKQLANVDYADELKRDKTLYEKVNTISEKYFEKPIKKQNQMQAMLSNLFGGGGAPALGGGNMSSNALM